MKKLLIATAALALAAGAFAQAPAAPTAAATTAPAATAAVKPAVKPAGEHQARAAERMKKIDANGDGLISRDEAKGHKGLEKRFDAIDANKDGQLSKDELKAYRVAQHGAHHGTKAPAGTATPAPKV